jgi:tRNA (cytidine/uridine-2'-O-)-methyltransferase
LPKSSDSTPKLRAAPLASPLHVVLVEPEIPPNTGNIARLCGATGSVLHLVGKLGFRIDEQSVRRAGVDYWHLVDVRQHVDFDAFVSHFRAVSESGRFFLFSGIAAKSYLEESFRAGDALVFGKESVGLSQDLLDRFADRVVAIPVIGRVRSLNLANAAGIALYEALRQTGVLHRTHLG